MSLFDISGLEFTVSGSDATIISIGTYVLADNSFALNIPATVDTSPTSGPYNVVAIGNSAFVNNTSVQRALLDGATFLTNIGELALYGCTNLTSITIPNSVTSIGYATFGSSGNITDGLAVTFAPTSSLQALAQGTFVNSFLRSIDIPSSVLSIGLAAFQNCQSLTNVTIPSSVLSLGDSAFRSCTNLTTITIPNSVTTMGESIFQGCSSLSSVTLPNAITSLPTSTFRYCSALSSITIPNSVTVIQYYAFANTSLTSVTIPSTVLDIFDGSFHNISALQSVVFAGGYLVGYNANIFSGCPNVTSMTTTDFGSWPAPGYFYFNNQILTAVGEPRPVNMLAHSVSSGNATITWLGTYSLSANSGALTIPSAIGVYPVVAIGASAFASQSSLVSVSIPSSVTSISNNAFMNTGLTSITIPNTVTTMGESIFQDSTSLSSVTLPNAITSLPTSTFRACTALTSITIPNSVTVIQYYAFANTSLTSVTIPSTVLDIFDGSFHNISALQSVVFAGGYRVGYNANMFAGSSSITSITTTDLASWPSPTYFSGLTLTQAGGGGGGDPYVTTISNIRYKLPAMNAPIRFYQGVVDGKLLTINAQLRTTPNADMTAENLRSYFEYKHKVPAHKRKELEYAVYAKEDLCFYEKFYISYNDSELVVNVWEPKFKFESYKGKVVSETSTRGDLIARCTGAYDHYDTDTLKFTFGSANLYISVYPNRLVRSSIYLETPAMSKGNGVIVNTLSVRHMTLGALNSQESVPKKDSAMKEKEEWFLDHVDYRTRKFYMAH